VGLLGSSLYAHIDSKEDLLVEVVDEGARLFLESARRAREAGGDSRSRLRSLIVGHIDVVLDHLDVVRTYLNEARMLDPTHRARVVAARDSYESIFRDVLGQGVAEGAFRDDLDPKVASIMVLSVLNTVERWYHPDGYLGRDELVAEIWRFVGDGLS
ncbi:MAG: TetR/AcrR family transcriptional regulator, partial [Acidimicrobiia bacterium]|nr:TetR/AcrR family transcriptional regulator [Acidimicrobiia bacterium]